MARGDVPAATDREFKAGLACPASSEVDISAPPTGASGLRFRRGAGRGIARGGADIAKARRPARGGDGRPRRNHAAADARRGAGLRRRFTARAAGRRTGIDLREHPRCLGALAGDPIAPDAPAEAREEARVTARSGVPLESLLHTYRVGHAVVWERALDVVEEISVDPRSRHAVLRIGSHWLFAYVDAIAGQVTKEYTRE